MIERIREEINDAGSVQTLRNTWVNNATWRELLETPDRIALLEAAMTRLLAIEARHEGDGR